MHCKLLFCFFYYSIISLGHTQIAFASPASSPRNNATSLATDFVPVTPLGGVAAVDLGSGISQLYYQNSADGIIYAYGVQGGPFVTGSTFFAGVPLIPADQVLSGSPIIAVTMTIAGVQQVHVFFISPTLVLSEWVFLSNAGWFAGINCPICITNSGFVVESGTAMLLYVLDDATTGAIRVGFISAGDPGTLSEASNPGTGIWKAAILPS